MTTAHQASECMSDCTGWLSDGSCCQASAGEVVKVRQLANLHCWLAAQAAERLHT